MKLSEVARIMYDMQKYCKSKNHQCSQCKYYAGFIGKCYVKQMWRESCNSEYAIPPRDWGITKADIERLERATDTNVGGKEG